MAQIRQINPTTFEVRLAEDQRMTLDFYGEGIVRWFRDDDGGTIRDPESDPEARILVDRPRAEVGKLEFDERDGVFRIRSQRIAIEIDQTNGLLKIADAGTGKPILEQIAPVELEKDRVAVRLRAKQDESFFGGGVQNGRFSHRGQTIAIENQNSWTDGGVASPAPFYWSTAGYGILWHTFKKGRYDFAASAPDEVGLSHETGYLDVFIMAGETPSEILAGYYRLTGKPVVLPKFGFYQGHLNAYNRDYWTEAEEGIPFEDGKTYKESQKATEGGIKESLNGEKDNYPFSARAVIDRYAAHDMPLGWVLPNDGYGAGYGQTDTLEGNIENLREFGDYARERGVEIGLWTQSDLHPKPDIEPLLQRDLVGEVRDAGVRVLKTDVAWVGAGYSFGLNGIADAAQLMTQHGDNSRPFIITLDGWAGTQRYAGVWTGDQTGGDWEYIRFHIPTYLGAGLSGMPNITSDMDGIFGGENPVVNTRDFQWKTFTPMQLNMDGWGANPKYPHALGEPATSINRWYLKLKSELMPYAYSIAHEAATGLPMVRAMFLEDPNPFTLGITTRYQFLYGPSLLVAPVYQDTRADEDGNDQRDNIYLPEGEWIDWFTGDVITGGRVINSFDAPLWKLPVFVKRGAILPLNEPHNQPKDVSRDARVFAFYPLRESSFTEYDDDGVSESYRSGKVATTRIDSKLENGVATLVIHPTEGTFDGFVGEKTTELRVNLTARPSSVMAKVNGAELPLKEVRSADDLNEGGNVFFYDAAPDLNRFATPETEMAELVVTKNPVLRIKLAPVDTSRSEIEVEIGGYRYESRDPWLKSSGELDPPVAEITEDHIGPYTLTPSWQPVANADYYEIEHEGMLYSTIRGNEFLLDGLEAETTYTVKLRAVNQAGRSAWTELSATTKANPLEFAISGIAAECSAEDQGGSPASKLVDFDESNMWHTKWGTEATPFELTLDLKSVNQLDKFQYLPRHGGGNGNLLQGSVSFSMDGETWTGAGDFEWTGDDKVKEFVFPDQPTARLVRLSVTEGKGKFGSGRELYVFKVPGSESYIPGDINDDGKIDRNDLTSYDNYTGLRQGDSDFEGYISKGDINGNGLIDAYDISLVATQLDGGVKTSETETPEGGKDAPAEDASIAGTLSLKPSKPSLKAGETLEISVSGKGLRAVNAISFALPYDPADLEFEGIEAPRLKTMESLTKDRLHTNGSKALYPTFVHLGDQQTVEGNGELLTIRFKVKRDYRFDLQPTDGFLVGKDLKTVKLWQEN
ncbi:TIM-barrel domain-containing protein [Haloferula helveola]